MNSSNLVGLLINKPKINENKEFSCFSKFQLLVKSPNKKYTPREWVKINCMAYGNEAKYIFRNCTRGTLVSVEGFLSDMIDERTVISKKESVTTQVTINYLVVTRVEAITTRKIVIEEWDDFINRYSSTSIKYELDKKKREEKKKSKELGTESYSEVVEQYLNDIIDEELQKSNGN